MHDVPSTFAELLRDFGMALQRTARRGERFNSGR